MNLNIRSSYNFALKAPQVLGAGYENAVVMGILGYDVARTVQDVTALHRAAYPYLGDGIPRDPKDLTYIQLLTSSGEQRVVAYEWLATAPTVVQQQNIRILVNNVSADQIRELRSLLFANGFSQFDIAVISTS